jgi:PAS domain S-box-containing protein
MEEKSKQELLYEINQLQEKLSEARETLHAIKKGEIDAFVVSDPDGEHIYTLESADYTYRVLVQSMNEGALILAQDGTIFYCNRRFAEMLKTSSEKLTGSSILEYVESVEHEDIHDLLLRAKNANCKTEHFFNAADGTQISVQLSVNSVPMNDTLRFCVVVTDLTERKLTEETQRLIGELKISRAELETRVVERTAELSANEMKYRKLSQEFRTLLNAISDTLILLSPDMKIMWANRGNAYLLNEMISEAVGQTCYHLLSLQR